MTNEQKREKQREYMKRYRKSEHGRAVLARLRNTPKAKAKRKAYNHQYSQSTHGKAVRNRYRQSAKGKATRAKYVKRYRQTPWYKAKTSAWHMLQRQDRRKATERERAAVAKKVAKTRKGNKKARPMPRPYAKIVWDKLCTRYGIAQLQGLRLIIKKQIRHLKSCAGPSPAAITRAEHDLNRCERSIGALGPEYPNTVKPEQHWLPKGVLLKL